MPKSKRSKHAIAQPPVSSGNHHVRVFLLATSFVLGGGIVVWWGAWSTSLSSAAESTHAIALREPPVPASQPTPRKPSEAMRRWVPGTLYRSEVHSDQKVSFHQRRPGVTTPPGMAFRINGEWDVGVVAVDGDRIDSRVHLRSSSVHVSADGQDSVSPQVKRALSTALERPFFVTFNKKGAVTLVHFERGTDVVARNLLRSLVASMQIVAPDDPKDAWQAHEDDTTGRYLAAYQRLAVARFEKKKQEYSHLSTPRGLQPVEADIHVDVRARATFALAEDLWPNTLEGAEHLHVDASAGMPSATYEQTVSFRLRERGNDPSLVGALVARRGFLDSSHLSSFQGVEPDPMSNYRQVLAGKRFEDLVKELRALPKEVPARDDARTVALEQLRALFMLQPAEALRVPGILRSGMDPVAASPMLGALSAASTPEAVKALVEITADRSLSKDIHLDAVAALGMVKTPTREGINALRNLTRANEEIVRDTATLALGNVAFHRRDDDVRAAESLVHELQSGYQMATTMEQQAMALRALGNTRDPSILTTVRAALTSSSPIVRDAAVVALRNVPEPGADQLLAARLLEDPSSEVRRAAVFSCGFRALAPLLPALAQALRTDPEDGVRLDIVQFLGANLSKVPEVAPLLLWASQNDSNEDIRRIAATFLSN